jgi:hypothetical protein
MKKLALMLLFAAPLAAQDLKHRPAPPPSENVMERPWLQGGEAITPGMVWAPYKHRGDGTWWRQREIGSCTDCLAPMSFKRALFNKKILTLLALDVAANVADTESTLRKPCIAAHTCREINPIMGNTRAQQYGIKFSITGVTWLCAAYLRKGDAGKHIGGDKRYWWTFVASIALHGTAATLNTARHN